jgi:phage gp45-like
MEPRDTIGPQVRQAAVQAFRGYKTAYNSGLITGVGFEGQTLANVHHAQPYGLRSNPPTDHELVYLQTAGGLIIVTSREDAADFSAYGLTEPADSAVMLYNSQGCSIHLDENGDIIHEPKSGRHIKLGDGATKALVLDGDDVKQGSAMKTWMDAVTTATSVAALVGTSLGTVDGSSSKAKGE